MSDSKCPNCGYCKHCGRSDQLVYPVYLQPYYPYWQWYQPTWTEAPTIAPVGPTYGVTMGTLTIQPPSPNSMRSFLTQNLDTIVEHMDPRA